MSFFLAKNDNFWQCFFNGKFLDIFLHSNGNFPETQMFMEINNEDLVIHGELIAVLWCNLYQAMRQISGGPRNRCSGPDL